MQHILEYLNQHLDEILKDIGALVAAESPSADRVLANRCGDLLAELAVAAGGLVTRVPGVYHADPVVVEALGTPDTTGHVLLVGHYDTVWPAGTQKRLPFAVQDGVMRGPGVFDMKTGLVQGLWALRALRTLGLPMPAVTAVFNADEEIGSPESRDLILQHARNADVALVLEPSAGGACKTARKGVARYGLEVNGRAAHAGLNPQDGVSAIAELAQAVLRVQARTNTAAGTTLNVGLMSGGTAVNVVPAQATAEIDVRFETAAEGAAVQEFLEGLAPVNPVARYTLVQRGMRPPMEKTEASARYYERLRRIAAEEYGFELKDVAVGGGSDGNLCAAAGTPVLDGLGAVGGGAHAETEHVIVADVPIRTALLASLISSLAMKE